MKYLWRNAGDYISRASLEVSNFVSHDGRLEHISTAAILHESPITEIHHQATSLIVQCHCEHTHHLFILHHLTVMGKSQIPIVFSNLKSSRKKDLAHKAKSQISYLIVSPNLKSFQSKSQIKSQIFAEILTTENCEK